MNRKRRDTPYKAYLVSAEGLRTPVEAHEIVIQLAPDKELAFDLAPHPNHHGLPVTAGPEQTLTEIRKSGFASQPVIRPGAGNVAHLFVERS